MRPFRSAFVPALCTAWLQASAFATQPTTLPPVQPEPPARTAGDRSADREDADAVAAAARARAADCAATLHLPIGPIRSCEQLVVTTSVTVTLVAGFTAWWHRGLGTSFSVANEDWFGPDTYAGGVDKLGHAFSFYVGTRLMNRALGWAGLPDAASLPLATGLALGLGLGIEVLDGFARGGQYGFSTQDLVMDIAGTGLAWLAETQPGFDRWFAFRWLRTSGGDPGRTYDHQQYYAVLRLSGWAALDARNPLRYVELMAGYGARGFQGDTGAASADQRARSVYVGIGLNLTELLDRTVFDGKAGGGRTQRLTTELLRYVQVPGTVATTAVRTWQP